MQRQDPLPHLNDAQMVGDDIGSCGSGREAETLVRGILRCETGTTGLAYFPLQTPEQL